MTPYTQYKESGVEWIGEIPAHWEIRRLKFFSEIVLGKMLTTEDKGGHFLKPYLRAKNLNWLTVDVSDIKRMWFSLRELALYRLEKGDLLVSEGGEVGRTCIWEGQLDECYIQNAVNRVRLNQGCSARYFLYLFYTAGQKGHFDAIVNRVSIAHLTKEKLAEVAFVLPSLPEQTAIATYLDRKTAEIDTLITKKQRLIELLGEERTAIISHAVTKGLDATVPLKDSGVEWIGEIPAHWETGFVKRYFKVDLGKMLNRAQQSDNHIVKPYLRAANVRWEGVNIDDINEMGFRSPQLKRYRLQKGDLLITEGGVTVGRSAMWQEEMDECYYQNSLNRVRSLSKSNTKFLYYWMYFLKKSGYIDLVAEKSTFGHLTNEKLRALQMTIPTQAEQTAIATYLDEKTAQIDALIAKTEKQVELLQEYRTALISSVVTGKVDVREEVMS